MVEPRTERYTVDTRDEWNDIARIVYGTIESYPVILLKGDLGVGKTTFAQAIAKYLGIEEAITSPTYSIVQEYLTSRGETVYHMDLYRLEDYEEIIGAGIEEIIEREAYYCVLIEWPELIEDSLDIPFISLEISITQDGKREIEIRYSDN